MSRLGAKTHCSASPKYRDLDTCVDTLAFWSIDRQQWIDMGDLYVGERMRLLDGSIAVVLGLDVEYAPVVFDNWVSGAFATGTLGTACNPLTGRFTSYNFEVAHWHTYFVMPEEASGIGVAVWVHNEGGLCDGKLWRLADVNKRRPGSVDKMNLTPDELAEVKRRSNITWVKEGGGARPGSNGKLYENGVANGRSETVPSIPYDNLTKGGHKRVKFDGYDGDTGKLIDRKWNTTGHVKTKKQVDRQAEALRENGMQATWEVPDAATAAKAKKLIKDQGARDVINVVIAPFNK